MMVTRCIFALFVALAGVSGTVGATTLTVEQLASHGHKTWGNRVHAYASSNLPGIDGNSSNTPVSNTGGSKSHTHSLAGSSGSANALPPYFVLAYIMRCA